MSSQRETTVTELSRRKIYKFSLIIITAIAIGGCATTKPTNPQDPYETFNRSMFAFNMTVDKYIYTPVASVYDAILPNPVKKGVNNFFYNIDEIPTVANDVLQGQLVQALADTWRFILNTTVGIGGVFDVATKLGLQRNHEDLGLTFAKWGAKDSPYLVLPFLGPSTVRDAISLPINYELFTIYPRIKSKYLRYSLLGVNFVRIRANLLPANKLMQEAFDPYIFVRNAYLQHRANLIKSKYPNDASGEGDTYVEEAANTNSPKEQDKEKTK